MAFCRARKLGRGPIEGLRFSLRWSRQSVTFSVFLVFIHCTGRSPQRKEESDEPGGISPYRCHRHYSTGLCNAHPFVAGDALPLAPLSHALSLSGRVPSSTLFRDGANRLATHSSHKSYG